MGRHVVAVEPFTKVGESDRVLDEYCVILRASDERSVFSQYQSVIFHWTPGLYFTHTYVAILGRLVCRNTAASLGSVT